MMATPQSSFLSRFRRLLAPAGIVILIVFAAIFPQQMGRDDVWNLFFLICLGIAMGQSWNMLGGFAGQTSLGHAAFYGLGALLTRTLWLHGLPFIVALLIGGLVAVAFAMVIGAPTFRLRGAYFAIGTLAVGEVMRITIAQNQPYLTSMSGEMIANYNLPLRYYSVLVLAIVTTAAAYWLLRSRWSLGILGVREDQEAAEATGVHVLRHKLIALGMSAFFMGLAGGMFAFKQISYYPENAFVPTITFEALMIAFIGGVGTVAGPVIGAIFFVAVRERLAANLTDVHQVIFGVLFVLVVLLLPGGLLEIWGHMKRVVARIFRAVKPEIKDTS